MSDRPSMYSQMVRAELLKTARCPGCEEMNRAGAKPLLELTDAGFYCNNCGHEWPLERSAAEAV